MKELVVISGKGGAGKTSVLAALAGLAQNKVVVDCDVDAADLHLIFSPEVRKTFDFVGGKKASIVSEKCVGCGRCVEVCKFGAVSDSFKIDPVSCEGCGACYFQCPVSAIDFTPAVSGRWYESDTRFGKLVHARLGVAEENSGKLVSEIKSYARDIAEKEGCSLVLCDGSPGVGCAVIASVSCADMALVVIEPTLSGIHDAARVFELARRFGVTLAACVNKFDLNLRLTAEIRSFCEKNSAEVVGEIPYSKDFVAAMNAKKTVVEFNPESPAAREIKKMWKIISQKL